MDNFNSRKNDFDTDIYAVSYENMGNSETKKKKINFKKFGKSALSFAIGVCLTLGVVSFAVPKMVENQLAGRINYAYPTSPLQEGTSENKASQVAYGKTQLSVVDIAKRVGPTVVGINTKVRTQNFFFGTMQESEGSGSGIILTADGYIVTNNHVIEGASSVSVVLNDGKTYEAKVTGADASTDLAVLKIDASGLPHATLGNSSELQVGELAVAIGNPLGNELAGTVTVGYISALNRSITVDDKKFNLIQTDAAINPGNSGGALVNCYGEIIGINSAKMSASGVEGIGFAIPIDEAKPIIEDLKTSGYVTGRPVIGIAGRDVTEQDSKYYGIPVGIYVYEVTPYSAAERAGIRSGDVITSINGKEVKTIEELNAEKEKHKVGDTVSIGYIRENKEAKTSLTLQEERPVTTVE